VHRDRDSLVGSIEPGAGKTVAFGAEHDRDGPAVVRAPVRRRRVWRRGGNSDAALLEPRDRPRTRRRRDPEMEDRPDRAAHDVAVKDVGARIAHEQCVGSRRARRPRNRAEVSRALDPDGDDEERRGGQREPVEGRVGAVDDGEHAVGPDRARDRPEGRCVHLDDARTAPLGA